MTKLFKRPDYLELIPSLFKAPMDELDISPDATKPIERLVPNAVAITAHLSNLLDADLKTYLDSTVSDFMRTRRVSEVIMNTSISLRDREVYKGYLSFKGTFADSVYTTKLLNLNLSLTPAVRSGQTDSGALRLINNVSPDIINNLTPFTIENNSISGQDLSRSCYLDAVVDVSATAIELSELFDRINYLLVHRLAVFNFISSVELRLTLLSETDLSVLSETITSGLSITNPTAETFPGRLIMNATPDLIDGTFSIQDLPLRGRVTTA